MVALWILNTVDPKVRRTLANKENPSCGKRSKTDFLKKMDREFRKSILTLLIENCISGYCCFTGLSVTNN
ncbi:hypothetical protein EUTSA_v10012127mg [Eutrema salsugineum]|uniref:Uncharacterized protein n=1 Tax=Eutrema salsugineum TaxID=72664 RepID=V4KKU3_EUTSA|nr:hypothetical protein EUTSA_v10012127mg [Eutrema salsugineum]